MKKWKKSFNKKVYKKLSRYRQNQKLKKIDIKRITIFIILIIIIIIFFVLLKRAYITHPLSEAVEEQYNNVVFRINLKKFLRDDEILENEMMNIHTTFKIGGRAKYFVKPKTINQIVEIIQLCNKYKVNYFILGNGSNILVDDKGYNGVVIYIHDNFSNLEVIKENENNYILRVGGGMLMKTLAIEACLLSLTGLEDIIDIPGTIGGGIIMNASFYGSGLLIPLEKVKVVTPEGEIKEITKKECQLKHRGSMLKDRKYLVIEAFFELKKGDQLVIQKTMTENTKKRYENQPMYFGSAGCFFAWDYSKYGKMYEKYKECNLVGYRIGNAMIFTDNISFIVNLGKASYKDVIEIVIHIEKTFKEKYGFEPRREVVVVSNNNLLKRII